LLSVCLYAYPKVVMKWLGKYVLASKNTTHNNRKTVHTTVPSTMQPTTSFLRILGKFLRNKVVALLTEL
jgi:hypothetical protein